MEPNQTVQLDRQQRLDEAVTSYLKALDAGERPDRQRWLADYPDIAGELSVFFTDADEVERLAAPHLVSASDRATPRPTSDATLVNPIAAPAGRMGDYELLQELARGGMGIVYRARQITLQREVALKMILAGKLASTTEIQRFRTEAEAAAQLDHPNIVPIYEVGEHDGQPFFTMKLIEGGSLAQHLPLRDRNLSTPVTLLAQVARAVHYAHQRGILHRDLKPANILLQTHTLEGAAPSASLHPDRCTPAITDFGLAKVVKRGSDLTRSGAIVGTPSYMAPEQAKGHREGVTTAADIYSLGAILYEMLTGSPPFRGETPVETLLLVLEQEPTPPRQINAEVDHDLETICLKCLEKDPRRRYESAEALSEELERWLVGEPIRARSASAPERMLKWTRRQPLKAGFIAACITLLVMGIVLIVMGWQNAVALAGAEAKAKDKANEARAQAEAAKREADEARAQAEEAKRQAQAQARAEVAAKKDAEEARGIAQQKADEAQRALAEAHRQTYYSRVGLAESYWRAHDVLRVQQLLELCPPNYRHWEWNYLNRLCHREVLTWKGHGGAGVLWVAYRPDGKQLASLGWDNTVKVWDARSGAVAWSHPASVTWGATLAVSPDGDAVAFPHVDENTKSPVVRLWNLKTKTETHVLRGHNRQVLGMTFSPSGKILATTGQDNTIRLWNLDDGKVIRSMPNTGAWCVAFSPDGMLLATGGLDGTVRLWDAGTGQEKHVLRGHTSLVHGVAFQPGGKLLASAGMDHAVRLWNVETAKETAVLDQNGFVFNVAFSGDGRHFASTCCDQTVKVWDAASHEEVFTLGGHTRPVMCMAFSPAGDRLVSASSDGSVRMWDSRTGTDAVVMPMPNPLQVASLTQDNNHLLTVSRAPRETGEALVWNLETGKKAFSVDGIGNAALSSDGKVLAAAEAAATGVVKLWDVATRKEIRLLAGHAGPVTLLAFNRKGDRLACSSRTVDAKTGQPFGEVKVWDVDTGKLLVTIASHHLPAKGYEGAAPIVALAFNPDGNGFVTAGSDRVARIWNAATGKLLFTTPDQREAINAVACSPDGAILATASGLFEKRPEIKLWDAQTGKELRTLTGHSGTIHGLAFSPDGKRIASASMDRTVKLWDTVHGEEIMTLHGHNKWVMTVAFTPDGSRLISGSLDKTVRIWDGRPLAKK